MLLKVCGLVLCFGSLVGLRRSCVCMWGVGVNVVSLVCVCVLVSGVCCLCVLWVDYIG